MPNGTGDPNLDRMLQAAPEQTPSSLYPLLHGAKTQDVQLPSEQPPQESLVQTLLKRLGLITPPTPEGGMGSGLIQSLMNRDQKMMDAKPKPGTYPIAMNKTP